jgi:PleD family two-component response regulator
MDLAEYESHVRVALESARDSLGRIEMHVREEGERADLMQASRIYAQFCMHVRDFLSGVHARRPLPRRLAQRVTSLRDELAPLAGALADLDLRPSLEDLDRLVSEAETLPGTS